MKTFKQKLSEIYSKQNEIIQQVHDATDEHTTLQQIIKWGKEMEKLRWDEDVLKFNLDEIQERRN